MSTSRLSFTGRSSSSHDNIHVDEGEDIILTLGGMNLKFDGCWKIDSPEFDKAEKEIEKLLNERDALLINLREALSQVEDLKGELAEMNSVNRAALDMVSPTSFPFFGYC